MVVRMDTRTRDLGHSTRPERSVVRAIADVAPRVDGVVKSAGRVLEILEFFNELRREARLAEIANGLGYPLSSTSVLLKSLIQLGYVDYDPHTRRYCPSTRVAMLGAWLEYHPLTDGRLVRLAETLVRRCGLTAVVAARNAIYSQIIHVAHSSASIRYEIPRGFRCFLCWSATGYALLTRAQTVNVPMLVRRSNVERAADMPSIDVREVLRNVEEAQVQGYFLSRSLVTKGAGALAMPLSDGVDRRGRPLAIAVSGPRHELETREDEIADVMRTAISESQRDFAV